VLPLAGTLLLARLAGAMLGLTLILFVLQRYHSPVLAGLLALGWMPGLLLSPLGGVLIDRFGRTRLIALDMGLVLAKVIAIVLLSLGGLLSPASLILVVGLGSVTSALTSVGTRSLIPLVVPSRLWERGNALDATTFNATMIAGPALAGLLFATVGGLATLTVIGGVCLAAALLVSRVRDAELVRRPHRNVLSETLGGLRYALGNPALRGLAVIMPLSSLGFGILQVALPVLFRSFPYGGSAVAGALWSVFGLAATVGAIVAGRMATKGRERRILFVTLLLGAAGYCVVAAAPLAPVPLLLAVVGMAVTGGFVGPQDIAMFSLRQRSIEAAWLGRAMSVSMSVGALGLPVGAALGGLLIQVSLFGSMALGAVLAVVTALLTPLLLPPSRTAAQPQPSG
jgi:MFS family permease